MYNIFKSYINLHLLSPVVDLARRYPALKFASSFALSRIAVDIAVRLTDESEKFAESRNRRQVPMKPASSESERDGWELLCRERARQTCYPLDWIFCPGWIQLPYVCARENRAARDFSAGMSSYQMSLRSTNYTVGARVKRITILGQDARSDHVSNSRAATLAFDAN